MSKTKESNKQTETLTTRSGSDLLVEALVHEDVDFIFGYPGGAVLPLYDTFYDEKIKHIRHVMNKVLPMPLKDTHVFRQTRCRRRNKWSWSYKCYHWYY